MTIDIAAAKTYFTQLQDELCQAIATEDGAATFSRDTWQRPAGGGGVTAIISEGQVFEKGAINFSLVNGDNLPASASAHRPELAASSFQALGISMIFHPRNPYVPTMHANCRLFVADTKQHGQVWWFGGGMDLTPYYGFREDCKHWHQVIQTACQTHGEDLYPRFKTWCDEYFYLKHRQEARGIGGIFFDDFNPWEYNRCFEFVKAIGNAILPAYQPIVERRKNTPYGEQQKAFQNYRRGRYVEFNLIYDRGTLFGLQSGGRTESILASMPPTVNWRYNWQPPTDTPEHELLEVYLKPQEWV
jgi:coproporphyrinogen III oxidase